MRFSLLFVCAVLLAAASVSAECTTRCVRKEIRSLSQAEVTNFTSALLQLNKKPNNYYNERYPITHYNFVIDPPIGADVHDTSFLPWHRYFLRQLELDLQAINPAVCLPYWNWTMDAAAPSAAPVFKPTFFGPGANSSANAGACVFEGPFTYENGWKIPQETPYGNDYCSPNYGLNFTCENFPGTTCLQRGYYGPIPTTKPTTTTTRSPTTTKKTTTTTTKHKTTTRHANAAAISDEEFIGIPNGHGCIIGAPGILPQESSVAGLINNNADSYMFWSNSVFCGVHNSVHIFLNGQMDTMLSPSDPLFFMHHGFIDVIFAEWQAKWNIPYSGNTYINNVLVPVNTTDILYPFGYSSTVPLNRSPITVASAWNINDLCYTYAL